MKIKKLLIISLFSILASGAAHAQNTGFGLGAMIGEPTGVSGKSWIDDTMAFDMGIGRSFDRRRAFHIHGGLIWHNFEAIQVDRGAMPVYFGVGARYRGNDSRARGTRGGRKHFGVRVPLGVAYHIHNQPIEVFGEFAPVLDFRPSTRVDLTAAAGVRFYFR